MTLPPDAPARHHGVPEAIAAVARELARETFPKGDLAALRRMDPDRPGTTAAFWSLVTRHVPESLRRDEDAIRRWALVLHGMALMAPDHHRGLRLQGGRTERLGAALRGSDPERPIYAEARLARLLGARGTMFRALVPRLCRQMKAADRPLAWEELAELVLTEGRDEERAERCRERIATAYYRAATADATDHQAEMKDVA
ncbi:type I-E CRISPR-associated protein Cse2/CasB [Benzoatithermus flavus]|uniref:Type I-E CRISPR-associated protein Cse2/CasB n=1 Tax=Benzoatithermus flavus TaxID=3108223 RepID=A0ABU8XML9_9PROT